MKTPQGEKKQELLKNVPKPGLRPGWDPQFPTRRGVGTQNPVRNIAPSQKLFCEAYTKFSWTK